MADELDLGQGIDLTPTSPSWAALFSVVRSLIASAGVIGTIWAFVRTKDLTGLYQFFHTSQFAGFLAALAAAASLAWGWWQKRQDKTTANALKAAIDPAHPEVQAIVSPGSTVATVVTKGP